QEVLGLDRRRFEDGGDLAGGGDGRARLGHELRKHQCSRLLSSTPAAMSRLACFLCTAWRLTPSASATSGQVHPSRIARSTSAISSRSASRRSATTAARPSAGSAAGEDAILAIKQP